MTGVVVFVLPWARGHGWYVTVDGAVVQAGYEAGQMSEADARVAASRCAEGWTAALSSGARP